MQRVWYMLFLSTGSRRSVCWWAVQQNIHEPRRKTPKTFSHLLRDVPRNVERLHGRSIRSSRFSTAEEYKMHTAKGWWKCTFKKLAHRHPANEHERSCKNSHKFAKQRDNAVCVQRCGRVWVTSCQWALQEHVSQEQEGRLLCVFVPGLCSKGSPIPCLCPSLRKYAARERAASVFYLLVSFWYFPESVTLWLCYSSLLLPFARLLKSFDHSTVIEASQHWLGFLSTTWEASACIW